MTSARLLFVVVLLCPFVAFSQTNQPAGNSATPSGASISQSASSDLNLHPSTPAQKSQTGFNAPDLLQPQASDEQAKAELALETAKRLMAAQNIDPNSRQFFVKVSPDGKVLSRGMDATCYRIRSYVMARDSKDSDAVHPVSYTTCVPANKVQVKTTILESTTP